MKCPQCGYELPRRTRKTAKPAAPSPRLTMYSFDELGMARYNSWVEIATFSRAYDGSEPRKEFHPESEIRAVIFAARTRDNP